MSVEHSNLAFDKLEVIPAAICTSLSILSARSSSVMLATAGVPVYFDLQLKDSWGNPGRPYPSSNFAVMLVSSSFTQTVTEVADDVSNLLSSSMSSGFASIPDLSMPGGLTATYYGDFDSRMPVAVSCQADGSWNNSQYCGGVDISTGLFVKSNKIYTKLNEIEIGLAQRWSVRYKGALRTTQSGHYTFFFQKTSCEQCMVAFSLNETSIFINANNFDSLVSATLHILHANSAHDVSISYKQNFYSEEFNFQMTYSHHSQPPQEFSTSNLFPLAGRFSVKAVPRLTSEFRAEVFTFSRSPALIATFYSQMDFREPFRVQEYSSSFLECGEDCMPLDPVYIRWSGFYKASALSTVSVFFSGSFCQYSLRLWLDGILYADLSQPTDGPDAARYINFLPPEPNAVHDLRIEYSKLRGNAVFSLNFTKNERSNELGLLYSRSPVSSAVGAIEVMSSFACATRSTVNVNNAVATAGHNFYAVITALDSFGNALNSVFFPNVSVFHGACSNYSSMVSKSEGQTSVVHISMNLYNVTMQFSRIRDDTSLVSHVCLRISFSQQDSDCLSLTVRVVPDTPCASLSRSTGNCLSLGTLTP
jgi:hypothetical protein